MLLSAWVRGGDTEKTHGGVGVSWFAFEPAFHQWQFCLPRQCSRFFSLCNPLHDLAPRRPFSRQCVLICPQLQRRLDGQLSFAAPFRDRHPLFGHDLEGRAVARRAAQPVCVGGRSGFRSGLSGTGQCEGNENARSCRSRSAPFGKLRYASPSCWSSDRSLRRRRPDRCRGHESGVQPARQQPASSPNRGRGRGPGRHAA